MGGRMIPIMVITQTVWPGRSLLRLKEKKTGKGKNKKTFFQHAEPPGRNFIFNISGFFLKKFSRLFYSHLL